MLSCASFYTLLAHGGMTTTDLDAVLRQWDSPHQQNSLPVFGILLVMLPFACFRPLHIHNKDAAFCFRRVLVTTMSPARMAGLIKLPFGCWGQTCMGLRNYELDAGYTLIQCGSCNVACCYQYQSAFLVASKSSF